MDDHMKKLFQIFVRENKIAHRGAQAVEEGSFNLMMDLCWASFSSGFRHGVGTAHMMQEVLSNGIRENSTGE